MDSYLEKGWAEAAQNCTAISTYRYLTPTQAFGYRSLICHVMTRWRPANRRRRRTTGELSFALNATTTHLLFITRMKLCKNFDDMFSRFDTYKGS